MATTVSDFPTRSEAEAFRILSSVRLIIFSVGGEVPALRLGDTSPECVGETLIRCPRPRPRLALGFVSGDPRKSAMSAVFSSVFRVRSSVRCLQYAVPSPVFSPMSSVRCPRSGLRSVDFTTLSRIRSSVRCLRYAVLSPVFGPLSSVGCPESGLRSVVFSTLS